MISFILSTVPAFIVLAFCFIFLVGFSYLIWKLFFNKITIDPSLNETPQSLNGSINATINENNNLKDTHLPSYEEVMQKRI
jgi:hypothetical protein